MELTRELWLDSQANELGFWDKEYKQDNLDQRQRNAYYLSKMEGKCSLIKDYLTDNPITDKVVMDLGSGPQGFLHVLKAKEKFAVDPLMDKFVALGYNIQANDVKNFNLMAEEIGHHFSNIDVVFCLNSIDHHLNPPLVIDNIYKVLKTGGDLILLTDLRLPEQCDGYHKLPLTQKDILSWLVGFDIMQAQIFPHGAGNPIMQFIVHAKKV